MTMTITIAIDEFTRNWSRLLLSIVASMRGEMMLRWTEEWDLLCVIVVIGVLRLHERSLSSLSGRW